MSVNVYASYNLFPDVDTFNISPQTVPYKSIQFETAYEYSLLRLEADENIAKILIRSSIYKQFELQLGLNTYIFNDVDGKASSNEEGFLGMKINLLNAANKFSLWRPGISLFFGSSFITSKEGNIYSPGAALSFSWYLFKHVKAEGSGKYKYMYSSGEKYIMFSGGGNLKFYLSNFIPFVEYYIEAPQTVSDQKSHFIQGGLRFFVTRESMIYLRAGVEIKKIELGKDVQNSYFGFGTTAVWQGVY